MVVIYEEVWFECSLVRNSIVKTIDGDMSAVVRAILKKLFFNTEGHDMSKSGIQLECHDNTLMMLFADLSMILADEAALHAIYACKGSSGLKPCLICTHTFNQKNARRIVERDPSGNSVDHACASAGKFKFITPSVMAAIVRRLRSAALTHTNTALEELQTEIGWKAVAHGIMFDDSTRIKCNPGTVAFYDWSHVFFVNGVFNLTAGLCLRAFWVNGVDFDIMKEYVSSFRWPHGISNIDVADVFSTARMHSTLEKRSLRCTASEGLSLFPVMALFCEMLAMRHPSAIVRRHAECFILFAIVAGMVVRSVKGKVCADALLAACQAFLTFFKELHGDGKVTPKFHYMFHLCFYLLRFWFLPNCLVHERKHKGIKRFANAVFNTSIDWDKSVLREFSCLHIERLISFPLMQFSAQAGLQEGKPPSRRMLPVIQRALGPFPKDQLQVARTARVNEFERVSVGDVVTIGNATPPLIGQVVMHISVRVGVAVEFVSMIEQCEIQSESKRSWKCKFAQSKLVLTGDIVSATTWAGDNMLTVLKPVETL